MCVSYTSELVQAWPTKTDPVDLAIIGSSHGRTWNILEPNRDSTVDFCIQKQLSENLLIGPEQYLVEVPCILWEILKTTMWVEIALWPQGTVYLLEQ